MISGRSPRMDWRPNPEGVVRTIEEAVEIATAWGVYIPADVEFFVAEPGWLERDMTARGPKITKPAGGTVSWSDHLNRYGKVPFLIQPEVLTSDEAIVAVLAHEMHELEALRPLLMGGALTIERYNGHTSPNNPGNFHDEAWAVADKLIEQMRQKERT